VYTLLIKTHQENEYYQDPKSTSHFYEKKNLPQLSQHFTK